MYNNNIIQRYRQVSTYSARLCDNILLQSRALSFLTSELCRGGCKTFSDSRNSVYFDLSASIIIVIISYFIISGYNILLDITHMYILLLYIAAVIVQRSYIYCPCWILNVIIEHFIFCILYKESFYFFLSIQFIRHFLFISLSFRKAPAPSGILYMYIIYRAIRKNPV